MAPVENVNAVNYTQGPKPEQGVKLGQKGDKHE